MIYYPITRTQYTIGRYVGKSRDGAIEFSIDGHTVSILSQEEEDNLEPEEEYSPVHGIPTARQLAYGKITLSRRTPSDIRTIRDTFKSYGGKRRTRRKRRGPTRI